MSALLHIKSLILLHFDKGTAPDLKVAVLDVINHIDEDLDFAGYETSFKTDEALARLDLVLSGQDLSRELEERQKEEESPMEFPSAKRKTVAPREEETSDV